jgi:hypothetical protein
MEVEIRMVVLCADPCQIVQQILMYIVVERRGSENLKVDRGIKCECFIDYFNGLRG